MCLEFFGPILDYTVFANVVGTNVHGEHFDQVTMERPLLLAGINDVRDYVAHFSVPL